MTRLLETEAAFVVAHRTIVDARAMATDAIGAGAGSPRQKNNEQKPAAGKAENGVTKTTEHRSDGRARTMWTSDQTENEADKRQRTKRRARPGGQC